MPMNGAREARLEKELNQEDLARACDVTRQTIGLIEAGDTIPRSISA